MECVENDDYCYSLESVFPDFPSLEEIMQGTDDTVGCSVGCLANMTAFPSYVFLKVFLEDSKWFTKALCDPGSSVSMTTFEVLNHYGLTSKIQKYAKAK